MSNLSVNSITNAAGGNTATINGMTPTADSLQGFRNRILNGGMVLDQRNNGASVAQTTNNLYTLDRWECYGTADAKFTVQQNAGSVTPPAGYTNYLGVTSSSAYSISSSDVFRVTHKIEGYNSSDLAWGSASAQAITLSFWVRSSLTGTFGAALTNSAQDRTYPFTYSISAANTWEQKTVTIAGDTTGTWLTNSGIGLWLILSLGSGATYSAAAGSWTSTQYINSATGAVSVVGTSGATFYLTGVQLEAGSVATPFERRPYGTELNLCLRYFEVLMTSSSGDANRPAAVAATTSDIYFNILYKVNKRTSSPTLTFGAGEVFTGSWNAFTSPTVTGANDISAQLTGIRAGLTQNAAYLVRNASITVSAEL